MSRLLPLPSLLLTLFLSLSAGTALAGKPDWEDKPGKGHKHRPEARHDDRSSPQLRSDRPRDPRREAAPQVNIQVQIGGYFGEPQRRAAYDYYEPRFKSGHCPPGLAKKHNGCLPPGHAKRWEMGRPLPRDVVYYPVPSGVSVHLGVPPPGYKYVRVAADILLIAVGTGMVIDAIEDLGRL